MTKVRQALGRWGEDIAAKYLIDQGMEILDRNWRCTDGEIDIIAQHVNVVIFCEVKTRRSERFGVPAEAITPAKARRLRRLAVLWITAQAQPSRHRAIRFDVISVVARSGRTPVVEHLRDVL